MTISLNQRLLECLTPGAATLLPGCSNALAARVIEAAGFEASLITGAGIANTYLGAPDIGLTSVTELADHVARIRESVEIPLIADGDTGFGNAMNVQRTVRLMERAGANGLQIEDQMFPKKCGHFEGKSIVSVGEMIGKIKAAVDARRAQDFLIVARTDAYATLGLSEALDRVARYKEAGADVLFVEAPQNVDELAEIPRQVPGVHLVNLVFGGKTPLLPRSTLAEMGFAGVIYANAALQASLKAMVDVLGHLRSTGSLDGIGDRLASFQMRQETVRLPEFTALEQRYAAFENTN